MNAKPKPRMSPPPQPTRRPHEIDVSRLEESGPHVRVRGGSRRDVVVIPAESLVAPTGPRRLIRALAAVMFVWTALWVRAEWKEWAFRDRISMVVVESHGNDARGIAVRVVDVGREGGVRVTPAHVKVEVGSDSALGRDVVIDVAYSRRFLPDASIHLRRRSASVPLVASTWDGKSLSVRQGH